MRASLEKAFFQFGKVLQQHSGVGPVGPVGPGPKLFGGGGSSNNTCVCDPLPNGLRRGGEPRPVAGGCATRLMAILRCAGMDGAGRHGRWLVVSAGI